MTVVTQAEAVAMARVVSDIRDERRRQIEVLGFSPERDDAYVRGELGMASLAYLEAYVDQVNGEPTWSAVTSSWPWDLEWWRPSDDPRRNLIKAGALMSAEIERVDRLISARSKAGGVQ